MNKKFINFMGMLAIIAGMTSCLKDKGFEDQDYGTVRQGARSLRGQLTRCDCHYWW